MVNCLCCIFLVIIWNPESESLASGAVYMIQNLGTKQCLGTGPLLTNGGNVTKALFKKGQVLTRPCSNISNFESTDFGQEWMIRIQKEEPQNLTFQVELVMENVKYNSTDLNATLNGEVVSYFPELITLKGSGLPGNETTQSHVFFIIDPATQQCLTDEIGTSNQVHYMNCTDSGTGKGVETPSQKWKFALINEIDLIRYELNLLKNLNASSIQPGQFHAL